MPVIAEKSLIRPSIELEWGYATDTGKVRKLNEDSLLAGPGVYVVADGMGGHQAGDVASRLTIEACRELATGEPADVLIAADMVKLSNERVRQYARQMGQEGMGSTLVGALLVANGNEDSVIVFNVGDSRCYALANNDVVAAQITKDHSLVQEMIDQGEISSEQAKSHRQRNVVTRAIGIEDVVAADFVVIPHARRLRLLLCSDGVSGEVSDAAISQILSQGASPQEAADALVAAVMQGKALDNATALVLDVVRPTLDDLHHEANDLEATGPRPTVVDNNVAASRFDSGATQPIPLLPPSNAGAVIESVTGFAVTPFDLAPNENVIVDVPAAAGSPSVNVDTGLPIPLLIDGVPS